MALALARHVTNRTGHTGQQDCSVIRWETSDGNNTWSQTNPVQQVTVIKRLPQGTEGALTPKSTLRCLSWIFNSKT